MTDNAVARPLTAPLSGDATAIQTNPAKLDFGNVKVGTISGQKLIRMTNTSSSTVRFKVSVIGRDSQDFVESNSCGRPLRPKGSRDVAVQFTPNRKGSRIASVAVNLGRGFSPTPVSLSGDGI